MSTQWHGWHLCQVEDHQEVQRLGSIRALDFTRQARPITEFEAAGLYHRPASFWSFGEAQAYLESPGNQPPLRAWQEARYR